MTAADDDNEFVETLRQALASDRPSAQLVASAKAAWTWRSIDAELAELLSDSSDDELVGVRSGATTRTLEFVAGETTIAVEVTENGASFELRGQITPASTGELTVESTSSSATLAVDADGWFFGAVTMTGLARLRIGGIVTDWFTM